MVIKAVCTKCNGTALFTVEDHLEPCVPCKARGWTFIEFEPFERRRILKDKPRIIDQGEEISYAEFDSRNPA